MSLSFRSRIASEGHPPDFEDFRKALPLLFDFGAHRPRLRTKLGQMSAGGLLNLSALRLQRRASFPCRTRHTRSEYP
jgi:hypothetical protein